MGQGHMSQDSIGKEGAPWLRISLMSVAVYLALMLLLGWFWSDEPEPFDVSVNAAEQSVSVVGG